MKVDESMRMGILVRWILLTRKEGGLPLLLFFLQIKSVSNCSLLLLSYLSLLILSPHTSLATTDNTLRMYVRPPHLPFSTSLPLVCCPFLSSSPSYTLIDLHLQQEYCVCMLDASLLTRPSSILLPYPSYLLLLTPILLIPSSFILG